MVVLVWLHHKGAYPTRGEVVGATEGKSEYGYDDHNKHWEPPSSHGYLGKLRVEVVSNIKIGSSGLRILLLVLYMVGLST